jgi:hypothetical protein
MKKKKTKTKQNKTNKQNPPKQSLRRCRNSRRYDNIYNKFIKHWKTSLSSPPPPTFGGRSTEVCYLIEIYVFQVPTSSAEKTVCTKSFLLCPSPQAASIYLSIYLSGPLRKELLLCTRSFPTII